MNATVINSSVEELPVGVRNFAIRPAGQSSVTFPPQADYHWDEMGRSTRTVVAARLRSGLQPLTLRELRSRGEALGYELRMVHTFTSKTGVEPSWEGVDARWHDRRTGLRHDADEASANPNRAALDQLRQGTLVIARGRILRQ